VSSPSYQTLAPGWHIGFGHLPDVGPGVGACCASCQAGGPCTGCTSDTGTGSNPETLPIPPVPIHDVRLKPGDTSFPVGFGQPANAPVVTTSVPVAVVASWAVPVAIAAVAGLFGFGVAYFISK
jgi:hypothetical protein